MKPPVYWLVGDKLVALYFDFIGLVGVLPSKSSTQQKLGDEEYIQARRGGGDIFLLYIRSRWVNNELILVSIVVLGTNVYF